MSDHLSSNLANNLKRLREQKQLSQEALSRLSGVPRPTLAHLESGTANPTLGVVLKVMNALDVSLETLVALPATALIHFAASRHRRRAGRGLKLYEFGEPPGPLRLLRLELGPKARWSPAKAERSVGHHLVCEAGSMRVSAEAEERVLSALESVVARSDDGFTVTNDADTPAVLYALKARRIGTG
jgi:transcriptional regulator with XRE-family HTH domain